MAHAHGPDVARPPRGARLARLSARVPPASPAAAATPAPGLRAERRRLRDPRGAVGTPRGSHARTGDARPPAVGEEPALAPGAAHAGTRPDRPRAQSRRRPQRHDPTPARRP